MRPRLRLFTGDELSETGRPQQIAVRLGEVTQLLLEAAQSERNWLVDFEDDEVMISADLFEIIQAYRELRPGA